MKNLIVILTTFLLISTGYNLTYGQVTQEWVRRYDGPVSGNDVPGFRSSLAVDGSGNVYVTGTSSSSGSFNEDYATIKYNSNGDSLWVRRYGGPGNRHDEPHSIAIDGSGNVYVTGGSIGSNGYGNYATIKYNSNGDSLWVKRYGPCNWYEEAYSIAVDGLGNVYVTGSCTRDYATIKYNSSGVQQWIREYSGPWGGFDDAVSLAIDDSGNVYVTGISSSNISETSFDYATIKYDSNGVQKWVRRYHGPGDSNYPNSIKIDGSGNVYVSGTSENDYATIKYNSNGDSLWVKRYSGPGNWSDQGRDLAVDALGNVYVTGISDDSASNADFATIKYNTNGDSLWVRRYNGPGNQDDAAFSLVVDGLGNVYVTGRSGINYSTIKYNSNGDSIWVKRYGPENTDEARSIAVDGSGNVYVTGSSWANGTVYDYATIKYSQQPIISTLHLTALIEGFYNNVTNKMIKDTVRVYLRNSTLPFAIVDSSKSVLDSTGNGILNFFNAANSIPYYIVIKHRNSIETWSSGGNSFLLNNLSYNFTTAANKAYGNNQKQIDSSPIQFGIYSGEVNQDGIVDASDVSAVDNDAFHFVSGYVRTDVNGNNFVDASDLSIVDNNAFDFVSIRRP